MAIERIEMINASPSQPMLFLVIETFRDGDPRPVYARFASQGRLAPEGLEYIASWVSIDLRRCYQVMRCADPALLEEWMAAWRDLVDFEVQRVLTSPEAAAAVAVLGHETGAESAAGPSD
jgi:hypothetical protein